MRFLDTLTNRLELIKFAGAGLLGVAAALAVSWASLQQTIAMVGEHDLRLRGMEQVDLRLEAAAVTQEHGMGLLRLELGEVGRNVEAVKADVDQVDRKIDELKNILLEKK